MPWAPWQLAQVAVTSNPDWYRPWPCDGLAVAVPFLLVALAAGLHLVVDEHRRAAVGDRQDVVLVRPVTLAALQQRAAALLVLLAGLGVDALDQLQPLVLVADGAHLPRRLARAAKAVLLGVRLVDLAWSCSCRRGNRCS